MKDPLIGLKKIMKSSDIITTRIHEVSRGVKVAIDKDKILIVSIKKSELAKDAADARLEAFRLKCLRCENY